MEKAPGWYDRHVLPYLLDTACGLAPIARQRALIVPQAQGRVLEIGIGTGLNLAFYDRRKVAQLVGVDPAAQMHALAQRRSIRAGMQVELVTLSAERLPLASASFDSVVCTYTLCSIPDPHAALREMRRVLKPGGKLFYAEHGLAPDAKVARHQARIEPWWSKIAGGCHLTRNVPELLREAGFHVRGDAGYIAWPRSLSYNFWGEATAP
ncbi:MAG TPA: class I SAM-dependent methyltransferase [Oxalicibacterium sp.]|nr:class I SAM-dependent methyltransferase [Oxalicibacterium sp.]